MKNNTLFLDIDGVMCPHNFKGKTDNTFDKKCVNVLNEIIKNTNCDIVISSDWRFFFTLQQLQEIFKKNKVNGNIIGVTTTDVFYKDMNKLETYRVKEINTYVKQHNINKYCAVDDMNLIKLDKLHFVHCEKPNEGIKQCNIKEKIIKILS